jgi:hypothetical protein
VVGRVQRVKDFPVRKAQDSYFFFQNIPLLWALHKKPLFGAKASPSGECLKTGNYGNNRMILQTAIAGRASWIVQVNWNGKFHSREVGRR